jgi:hypothetical protein
MRRTQSLLIAVNVNEKRALLILTQSYVKLKRDVRQKGVASVIASRVKEPVVPVNSTDVDLPVFHVANLKLKSHNLCTIWPFFDLQDLLVSNIKDDLREGAWILRNLLTVDVLVCFARVFR